MSWLPSGTFDRSKTTETGWARLIYSFIAVDIIEIEPMVEQFIVLS